MDASHKSSSLIPPARTLGGGSIEHQAPVGREPLAPRNQAAALPPILAAELKWLGTSVIILLLLTQIPATVERILGPSDRIHLGTYLYVQDFSQYLPAMRDGAATPTWLVHDHLTSEPHDPAFIYPLYVGTGTVGKG